MRCKATEMSPVPYTREQQGFREIKGLFQGIVRYKATEISRAIHKGTTGVVSRNPVSIKDLLFFPFLYRF